MVNLFLFAQFAVTKELSDEDAISMRSLLEMADLALSGAEVPATNNETKAEKQNDIATSDKPFLLDENNFHDYVIDADTHQLILDRPWFILFFSPKCIHCTNFKPTWEEFHEKYKGEINIASIDCVDEASAVLCIEYNILAYPTLKYIPTEDKENPVMYQYSMPRTIESLEKFSLEGQFM